MCHAVSLLASRTFQPFGVDHVAALAVIAMLTTALILAARRACAKSRSRLAGWSAALLIAEVVFETPYELAVGAWRREESLPLHLCDLALLVTIATLFLAARDPRPPFALTTGWAAGGASPVGRLPRSRTQTAYELCWYWGLAGTVQALLTPSVFEAFPDPLYIIYFIAHGGIVTAALLLTIGFGWRPRPGSPWRAILLTYALSPFVGVANWLLGANYMYLCGPPPTASIYDYFGPWPWSLITLAAAGVVLMWLCYVPFVMLDFARRNRSVTNAPS